MTGQQVEIIPAEGQTGEIRQGELTALIDAVARRPRRDLERVTAKVCGMVRISEDVARHMYYAIPRDGKTILGPSIELAELIQQQFGGIAVSARLLPVEVDRVVAEAIAYDLETLTVVAQPGAVRITKKDGTRYNPDMIHTAQMSAVSKAKRNAIFALVPRLVMREIVAVATKTVGGEETTLPERRRNMVTFYAKWNVPPDVLLQLVHVRHLEDITTEKLAILLGLAEALRAGEVSSEALGIAAEKATKLGDNPQGSDIKSMLDGIMDDSVTQDAATEEDNDEEATETESAATGEKPVAAEPDNA